MPFFPVADFCFNDGSCPHASVGQTGGAFVLPEEIVKPFRHDTLHKLMRSLAANGVPLDAAIAACRMVNQTRCRPPLADNPPEQEIDDGLDRFLRRAYHQKDRADFVRAPKAGGSLPAACARSACPPMP